MHDRATDLPALDGDEPLRLQHAQGLAHRRAADPELGEEAVEARKALAVGESAGDDQLADALRNQVGGAGDLDVAARQRCLRPVVAWTLEHF